MTAITKTLAALLMCSTMVSANAAYTLSNTNGGTGSIIGTYPDFTITGDDSNSGTVITLYSDTIFASGIMSFQWQYSSIDDPAADYAGYSINGDRYILASSDGASGTENISLNANDIFGWFVRTEDGQFGPGILEVTSATFEEDGDSSRVPEPASLALFGLALVGMAGSRRHSR